MVGLLGTVIGIAGCASTPVLQGYPATTFSFESRSANAPADPLVVDFLLSAGLKEGAPGAEDNSSRRTFGSADSATRVTLTLVPGSARPHCVRVDVDSAENVAEAEKLARLVRNHIESALSSGDHAYPSPDCLHDS